MDLNAASPSELQRLPGVGPVTARLIMESRPFSSVEGLLGVKGIGPAKYAAITRHTQLHIGDSPEQRQEADTAKGSKTHNKIDLNAASNRQLQQLKGVGPALAQRIVDSRPFHRKEDLLAVKGIGAKSYLKMHKSARVNALRTPLHGQSSEEEGEENKGPNWSFSRETFQICREIEKDVRANVFPMWRQNGDTAGCGDRALLVASWNIRNFSRRKEAELLERIAEILGEFDLVALQEIRDLLVLKRLKTMLPGWDYVVSEPVGRKAPRARKRAEHFAFFFRRSVMRPVDKCYLVGDSNNVFTRPPCIMTFQAIEEVDLPGLELTLMNVHVSFGEKEIRHNEIVEINRLAAELTGNSPTGRKVVVLGDFNLSPQDVLGSLGSHRIALIRSPLSTTVFNKLYDNIWLDRADFNNCFDTSFGDECEYLVDSGVLRIDWRYYPPSKSSQVSVQYPRDAMLPRLQTYMSRVQCGYELSDHCPVWVAFTAAGKL
ncbi:hypothetical protein PHYBOEH_007232 [Phytophthora boehmeriae]|uniref:Helix-hairpin-helix DNA-binding motif class 1 domain-containing protein n=1 Tax=Phytophthora boehmeriae TaxID=109152 RepID=A0A8T1W775_9STRA|nr:hypothetical protein PHYBOEH_007232 [Phytophthora boehmeriae]